LIIIKHQETSIHNVYFSIIVPVFNVEKYLAKCLDSIINQTFQNIEIICINDGSKDRSREILREYEKKDGRINVIDKINEGLGFARKTGLNNANGKYIIFVDSDDWIENDYCEKIYQTTSSNNPDLILLDYYEYYGKNDLKPNGFYKWFKFKKETKITNITLPIIKPFLLNRFFAAWTKVYSKSFLDSYSDFYFPKDAFYEDVFFHVQVLTRAKIISYCPNFLYYYNMENLDSITSKKDKKIFEIFKNIDLVDEFLIKKQLKEEYKFEYFLFLITKLNYLFNKIDDSFKEKFFKTAIKRVKKLNLTYEEFKRLNSAQRDIYCNFIKSDTYRELELYNNIVQIKKNHKEEIKEIKNLLNTKPYKLACMIRRFKFEFIKGNLNDKKQFLTWIFSKNKRQKKTNSFC
jgi:glycosyltransferase involved in cell wall biosynthesis